MTKTGLLILLTLFMIPAWAQLDENTTLNEEALLEEELEPVVSPVVDNPIEVTIKEWPVPWKDSRPRDPDVAPNGVIWLVGQGGDYAARFDPASEEFTQKVLPPGTGPHNLIVDRDGSLWIPALPCRMTLHATHIRWCFQAGMKSGSRCSGATMLDA